MNFFWFQRYDDFKFKELSEQCEGNGLDGILFAYSFQQNDYFVKIANQIDLSKKIKYMVAIRPYTISAQYLSMISSSFKKIAGDRLLINLISGWIYDHEKSVGGILGEVKDTSSNIERSNYLIEYVKSLESINGDVPNFYVSVTNDVVFNSVKNHKVIVPYSWLKANRFDIVGENTMIYITPVIRKTQEELDSIKDRENNPDTEYFTYDTFSLFLKKLNEKQIKNILVNENENHKEKDNILSFVSYFTNKEIKHPIGGKNE
jgi:sporulation protein YlmC with PRC-barrel domain